METYVYKYVYIYIYIFIFIHGNILFIMENNSFSLDPMRLSKIRLRCEAIEAIEAIEASRAAEQPPTLTCRRYMADVDDLTFDAQAYRYDHDYPDTI